MASSPTRAEDQVKGLEGERLAVHGDHADPLLGHRLSDGQRPVGHVGHSGHDQRRPSGRRLLPSYTTELGTTTEGARQAAGPSSVPSLDPQQDLAATEGWPAKLGITGDQPTSIEQVQMVGEALDIPGCIGPNHHAGAGRAQGSKPLPNRCPIDGTDSTEGLLEHHHQRCRRCQSNGELDGTSFGARQGRQRPLRQGGCPQVGELAFDIHTAKPPNEPQAVDHSASPGQLGARQERTDPPTAPGTSVRLVTVNQNGADPRSAPAGAQLCAKCSTTAVIMMDGCMTCLSCGDSKCG
jgi:hypothetical protein